MPRAPSTPYLTRIKTAIAARFDGWFNGVTGVGGQNGRGMMQFGVLEGEYLGLQDVEALYNFDGVAARVVDSVPEHSLRQGFTVSTGDSDEETAILAALDGLHAVEMLKRAWTWGRLFGGGAIYIGADDGNPPEEPLDESTLRRINWLSDVDRRDLYPVEYDNDPESARFGQPLTYQMNRMGGARAVTMTVHHTRLIRFEGVTPTRRRRLQLLGWGDSVLQRCYAELMQMRGAFAASGDLVQQASQGVLKMRGLMDMMASDTDDLVKRRLWLMDQSRSIARSILLDADGEDFSRVDAGSLSGVADIMDRMVNLLAAVTKHPVTVLMGQAPAGLNATGDSDIRNWYDALQADRESTLRPRAGRIVELLLRSQEGPTGGVVPKGWRVVFPPLWQSTPAEEADLRAKQATVDQAYITSQVLTPEEVALSRFRKEGYSTDTSIDLDVRKAMIDADKTAPPDAAKVDGKGVPVAVVMPLPLDVAQSIGLTNGEPVNDLHLTLAFLGRRDLVPWETDALKSALELWARERSPLRVRVGELGRFKGTDPAKGDPIIRTVTAPDLLLAREDLVKMLSAFGFEPRTEHAYVPHVTLAYIPADKAFGGMVDPVEVSLDRVALWAGDTRVDVALEGQGDRADGRHGARSDGEGRYGHIDFTPPKGAGEAAQRALEVRAAKPPSERGMTEVGIARARDLSNGKTLSPDTVRRMLAYFTRHEGDKTGATWDDQGKGWQAWNGWGGDAGYAWARKVVKQMDAVDDGE